MFMLGFDGFAQVLTGSGLYMSMWGSFKSLIKLYYYRYGGLEGYTGPFEGPYCIWLKANRGSTHRGNRQGKDLGGL